MSRDLVIDTAASGGAISLPLWIASLNLLTQELLMGPGYRAALARPGHRLCRLGQPPHRASRGRNRRCRRAASGCLQRN